MYKQLIDVLLVDDHLMVRKGIRALLKDYDDIQVIGEAATQDDAIEKVNRSHPDVVVIDLFVMLAKGVDVIRSIIAGNPAQRILVLTNDVKDDFLRLAIKAGAKDYLSKDSSPEALARAIRSLSAGESLYSQ